jgi:hypothetical protein
MSHIGRWLGVGLFVFGVCAALAVGNQASAGVMSVSSTFPTVDNADLGQSAGAADLGGAEGHIWSDRPVQGQVFKTGSNPAGYLLSAMTLQNRDNNTTSGTFRLRVGSLGTVSGTVLNELRYETSSNTVSYTAGQYVTGTLSAPIWLRPNSYYGFDWGNTGSGFVTQSNLDTNGDVYTDGKAYSSGIGSTPAATITLRNGDRVFHLDMIQAAARPVSNGNISVNFATATSSPAYVTGTAGVEPLANWNNVALTQLAPSGTNVQLRDSAGDATTATITYSAPNTWGTPNGSTATDDGQLMKGYLDTGYGTNMISISVANLGPEFTHRPGYDVIVYCDTDGAGTRGFQITDSTGYTTTRWLLEGSTSYDFGFAPQNMGFVQGDYLTEAAAQSGVFANYVVLSGLHGSSFTLTMLNGSTGDVRSRINGFQIIANIPEPSTVMLLAFGVACLVGGLGRRPARPRA